MQIPEVGTRATGMGQGEEEEELSQDHSHLAGLRWRPRGGPLERRMSQTLRSTSTGATIPPSSMYHFWYTGQSLEISSTREERPKQK